MRPEAKKEAWGWVERADADLRTVEILLAADGAPLDVAAFHLQQAVEKLLLKAGSISTSLEVDDRFGTLLHLSYCSNSCGER